MPKIEVYKLNGQKAGTQALDPALFGRQSSPALLSHVIRVLQERAKPRTAHTKTRGEVSGGGRKPFRQKGTGRARAGSIRSPLWKGGGTVFGPRAIGGKVARANKGMRRAAFLTALSEFAREHRIVLVQDLTAREPKTKWAVSALNALPLRGDEAVLVVGESTDVVFELSARNIPTVRFKADQNLTLLDLLTARWLVISRAALGSLARRYLAPASASSKPSNETSGGRK